MLIEDKVEMKGVTYEICGEIGEGGVGHVFVVRDSTNNKFALKIVSQYGRNPIIK
jgi:RIO-like serine/threonine protein kinase